MQHPGGCAKAWDNVGHWVVKPQRSGRGGRATPRHTAEQGIFYSGKGKGKRVRLWQASAQQGGRLQPNPVLPPPLL